MSQYSSSSASLISKARAAASAFHSLSARLPVDVECAVHFELELFRNVREPLLTIQMLELRHAPRSCRFGGQQPPRPCTRQELQRMAESEAETQWPLVVALAR